MSQNNSLDNLSPILGELITLRAKIKDLEARKKELEATVRPALADRGAIEHDGYVIKVETMPGRATLDRKAVEKVLEDEGYDIEDFIKRGAPFSQLTIR